MSNWKYQGLEPSQQQQSTLTRHHNVSFWFPFVVNKKPSMIILIYYIHFKEKLTLTQHLLFHTVYLYRYLQSSFKHFLGDDYVRIFYGSLFFYFGQCMGMDIWSLPLKEYKNNKHWLTLTGKKLLFYYQSGRTWNISIKKGRFSYDTIWKETTYHMIRYMYQ